MKKRLNVDKRPSVPAARERKRKPKEFSSALHPLICETMGQAASMMGIEMSVLRAAKRDGAPGFINSRVVPSLVAPWLKAQPKHSKNGEITKDEADRRSAVATMLRKEHDNNVELGLYYEKQIVHEWLMGRLQMLNSTIETKLKQLFPKLEGLRAPEMLAKLPPVIEDIGEALRGFEEHAEKAGNESAAT